MGHPTPNRGDEQTLGDRFWSFHRSKADMSSVRLSTWTEEMTDSAAELQKRLGFGAHSCARVQQSVNRVLNGERGLWACTDHLRYADKGALVRTDPWMSYTSPPDVVTPSNTK